MRFICNPWLSWKGLFVNAVLLLRTVHLDLDLRLGLDDFNVVTISLERGPNGLDSHLYVRLGIERRLAFGISLQLHAALRLLTVLADRMESQTCIAHGLTVVAATHQEIDMSD